jgi:CCR4-NOT transcription complex subunit 7/8
VVARPIGSFKTSSDYHYQTMRCNVDLLKIIQIGITLSNDKGELPEDVTTWQFNFHFSVKSVRASTRFCAGLMLTCPICLSEDIYGPDSVDLLQKSGIDFQKHEEFGIPPTYFAELMITSGLVLSDDTTWVSFHRFALLSGQPITIAHIVAAATTLDTLSKS